MQKYFSVLRETPLFAATTDEELAAMLHCLATAPRAFAKGDVLLLAGEPAQAMGIVCEGTVHIVRDSLLGDRTLVAALGPGEVFAETLVCAQEAHSPVNVLAATACVALFLHPQKLLAPCTSACPQHTRLIGSMLRLLAQKNLYLQQKMDIMAQKTTRDKLLAFFDAQLLRVGGDTFTLPFTREALADYLGVNRSAMSRELSALRAEGILTVQGRQVTKG